ncbi:DUF4145 domain-containing protein [Asaia sp. VD9]|uniref:DUF4145 domain-containing protein n=1 Tax=Asaia sp. VD9 TaxID=3081235 RepID=UPI003018E241
MVGDISKRKAECSTCGGERNCYVRAEHQWRVDSEDISAHRLYQILECAGCEHTFVRVGYTNSEDYASWDDGHGNEEKEYIEHIEYLPALAKRARPEWLDSLFLSWPPGESRLYEVLDEVYKAIDAGLVMLSAVGVRTAFDVVAAKLGVDAALSFEEKLDELLSSNHIRSDERAHLAVLIEAGNAAAHRGWFPRQDELVTLIDLLERFVTQTVIEPEAAKRRDAELAAIRDGVPPKQKRLPKPKLGSEPAKSENRRGP